MRIPKPACVAQTEILVAGGFLLSGQTVAEIERVEVPDLHFPRPLRRALLLDRDGLPVDERLHEHLLAHGLECSVQPGPGYGEMIAKPHTARAPRSVFATVARWLSAHPRTARSEAQIERSVDVRRAAAKTPQSPTAEAHLADTVIESVFTAPQPFGSLFGVLASPVEPGASGLCAVLLNAGAIRRVGPNRMWVEAARRWATDGIPTLRLDLEGIGDADGNGERLGNLAELVRSELGLPGSSRDRRVGGSRPRSTFCALRTLLRRILVLPCRPGG